MPLNSPLAVAFVRGFISALLAFVAAALYWLWYLGLLWTYGLPPCLIVAAGVWLLFLLWGAVDQHRCARGEVEPGDVAVCVQSRKVHQPVHEVARALSVRGGPS